ncbi:MAG: PA domain-containing protein [Gaiellaceae bacterium]
MSTHRLVFAVVLVASVLAAPAADARPERHGGMEMFPGEGVLMGNQHSTTEGHLPPVNQNVQLVGKAEVTNPSGASNDGRVADVSAHGNYAFLTAFRDPTCERGGAHVIDMSDPKNPFEVTSAFMDTTEFSYAGEGSVTHRIRNQVFDGVIFVHQNETCPGAPAPTAPATRGGINIWDITDPESPDLLVKHAGDFTNPAGGIDPQPNDTHNVFVWTNVFDGRTYAVLVDNEEFADLDIMDISDPRNPVMVNDTLDLFLPPFNVGQDSPANLTSIFSHDMIVKRVGQRYVMNAAYWDGGYVLLDVTDPTPGNVSLIAESDFAELDEERLARGHEISPEGNGHQSELSPDNKWLVAADEDFNAYRVVAEITSGPNSGTEFTALSGSGVPPIDPDTNIIGTPTFVGLACIGSVPPGDGIALIERGVCSFQEKLDTVKAAGYDAGIVFNAVRPDCAALVFMAAVGDIPFVFVDRATGLLILNQSLSADVCTQASPAVGSPVASVAIEAVFDGWGYLRLFRTNVPGQVGAPGSIQQTDTFAIPESQDEAFAEGFGDLSVHEVAVDPKGKLAYVSYYAGGFRILKYGPRGLRQVGAFIDEGGNNFWGVEIHKIKGKQYVLASDRDFGLYIFRG